METITIPHQMKAYYAINRIEGHFSYITSACYGLFSDSNLYSSPFNLEDVQVKASTTA